MVEKGGLWYFDIFKNDFVQTKAASDIFILLVLAAWCDCSPCSYYCHHRPTQCPPEVQHYILLIIFNCISI